MHPSLELLPPPALLRQFCLLSRLVSGLLAAHKLLERLPQQILNVIPFHLFSSAISLRPQRLCGESPASISNATWFLISCRASHRYFSASFLNTCFFSVSEPIPRSSSFFASSNSLLKS